MTSELHTRVASGLVLAVVALILTIWSVESFAAMCVVGGIVLWREWRLLTRKRGFIFIPAGIFYIVAAVVSLIYLRMENVNILLAVFAIVCAGDIAAYFVGKRYG